MSTKMTDTIIRGIAGDGQILAFACDSFSLVEEARCRHDLCPQATIALGRLLSAAAMMSVSLKGRDEQLILDVSGSGPLERIVAMGDGAGRIRGYVKNPNPENIPEAPIEAGAVKIADAVGLGVLSITKDLGLKEPYVGSTHLVTSEIGDDLAYYFLTSEQVPSAVSLGVLLNKDGSVWSAGGYIVQLMPGASEETVAKLEDKLHHFMPSSHYLALGHSPEELLKDLLGEFGYETLESRPCCFSCTCNHGTVERALISLGKEELQKLIDEDEPVEMCCNICGEKYMFSVRELKELLASI